MNDEYHSIINDEQETPGDFDPAELLETIRPTGSLTHAKAKQAWNCGDADLAGWVNSNKVLAYREIGERLYPFNWFSLQAGDNWRARLPNLLYCLKPGAGEKPRYLLHAEAVVLINEASPDCDAVAVLADKAGLLDNALHSGLWAINLLGEPLTANSLTRCIFLKEQVEAFAQSAFGVKRVYSDKEIVAMRHNGDSVDAIVAKGPSKHRVTGLNDRYKIPSLKTGPKKRRGA